MHEGTIIAKIKKRWEETSIAEITKERKLWRTTIAIDIEIQIKFYVLIHSANKNIVGVVKKRKKQLL